MIASITGSITSAIGDYGLYAVFLLMAVDAVFPAASELVMVYAGAVAIGAFPEHTVTLFGTTIDSTGWAYVTMALAGTLGYTLGSVAGWAIGYYGGRPYLERHGRWLHVTPEKLDRAVPWTVVIPGTEQEYHIPPEIFVSEGSPGSIVHEWVRA